MQRVSAFLPSWDKRNSGNKSGSLFAWGNRTSASGPSKPSRINVAVANANANGDRIQREAFWPATLDLECDKAARILKSFCTDGYLAPADGEAEPPTSSDEPSPTTDSITKKIPKRIIQNAAGIAVFTCMRSGLWMTGSGGSGILIARKSDGTWSPPSGILLHTPTLSFIIGVDIYDCVLVINNLAALESITRPRVTLGEDVGLTNGPSVTLDSDEAHIKWKELGNTVLAYMKARGQHQAVNLNGCILTERTNENERFYGGSVTQMDVLAGNVARHVEETKPLFEVIKMAEGRTDYEPAVIEKMAVQPAPGDAVIATPSSTPASPRGAFGVPRPGDPDPFGVLALEMAGLEIREAGSHLRPSSSQFEYNPSPLSPSMSKFSRQSVETFTTRSNRASVMSSRTVKSQVTDAYTQTDTANTPDTTPSPGQSDDGHARASIDRMPEVKEHEEVDYTRVDLAPLRHLSQEHSIGAVLATDTAADMPRVSNDIAPTAEATDASKDVNNEPNGDEEDQETDQETNDADDEDDLDEDEEPVVFEVAAVQPTRTQAIASRVIHAKGNMVTIPKRVPPPLPMRSALRNSRSSKSDMGGDVSSVKSPLRQAFSETDLRADEDVEQGTPTAASIDKTMSEDGQDDISSMDAQALPVIEIQTDKSGSSVPSGDDTVTEDTQTEKTPTLEASPVTLKTLNLNEDTSRSDPAAEVEATEPVPAETDDTEGNSHTETTGASQMANGPEKADEDLLADGQIDHTDNSDSTTNKKHTSSIYTGATEDRWSNDGSPLTTPTSERPRSMTEDETRDDDTPKKSAIEAEMERPDEKHAHGAESNEAVATEATVA
ncbi:LAS seventeen-binding protein [Purpureocillium lavendulum]|uniref:LAS seventeen-binding protein n=1 Tax=Purpureocillium lavendulum TaxID=1247861 RepID=A0AB34G0B6_9HYPO|nr:LAS seventeen-binding protein [Purpureocillium lavendulum]